MDCSIALAVDDLQTRESLPNQAPSISDDQIIEQTVRLGRRLSSHLNRIDAGDSEAEDDLAVVLRILLCPGEGDKLLLRVAKRFHLDLPDVSASPPAADEKDTYVSLGAVPDDPTLSSPGFSQTYGFSQWVGTTALVLAATQRKRHTWAQVISDFGNTYGAHVGKTVPEVLSEVELLGASHTSLGSFLLRRAGVVAEKAIGDVLDQLGKTRETPHREWTSRSTWPTQIDIGMVGESMTRAETMLGLAPTLEAHRALDIPLRGGGHLVVTVGEGRQMTAEVVAKMDLDGSTSHPGI